MMDGNNSKGNFKSTILISSIVSILVGSLIGYNVGQVKLGVLGGAPKGNKKIDKVENIIKKNYLRDIDEEKLVDGKLKGLVASLGDPYSVYMTQEEFNNLLEGTHGSFGGVGIVVSVDIENDMIVIISPVEDTPGERAGLKPGDRIIEVNGKVFTGKDMSNAVKEMKGEIGSKVSLKIVRNFAKENQEIKELELTREEIRINTVKHQMLEDSIGYINLTSFDELTYDDFKKALADLERDSMKKLIIDLRGNPGGLMDVTVDLADLFLDKGDIVYTEDKSGNRQYERSNDKKIDYPLVVLVDEGSASASEIFAGAIKDRKRGKIVGMNTFGKGVVQRLIDLGDGSGLKLTISEYFTPNGIKIDGIGITPDIEVELPSYVKATGPDNLKEDLQLKKAIEVLKKETPN